MRLRQKSNGDHTVLSLSGDLDIYHAEKLRESLLKALDEYNRLEIAFGEVGKVDLSFLQILYSADKTARVKGKELIVSEGHLPDPVSALCYQTGFDRDRFFTPYCSSGS